MVFTSKDGKPSNTDIKSRIESSIPKCMKHHSIVDFCVNYVWDRRDDVIGTFNDKQELEDLMMWIMKFYYSCDDPQFMIGVSIYVLLLLKLDDYIKHNNDDTISALREVTYNVDLDRVINFKSGQSKAENQIYYMIYATYKYSGWNSDQKIDDSRTCWLRYLQGVEDLKTLLKTKGTITLKEYDERRMGDAAGHCILYLVLYLYHNIDMFNDRYKEAIDSTVRALYLDNDMFELMGASTKPGVTFQFKRIDEYKDMTVEEIKKSISKKITAEEEKILDADIPAKLKRILYNIVLDARDALVLQFRYKKLE